LNNSVKMPLTRCDKLPSYAIFSAETLALSPGQTATIKFPPLTSISTDCVTLSLLFLPVPATISETTMDDNYQISMTLTNDSTENIIITDQHRLAQVRQLTTADILWVENSNTNDTVPTSPTETELQSLIQCLNIDMSQFDADQSQQVRSMLSTCYEVFSINDEVGLAKIAPLDIKFLHTAPIRCKPYTCNAKDALEIEKIVQKMQEDGLASRASGVWASPTILVRHPGKTPRLVFDYRLLNKSVQTHTKAFLPAIDDLLSQIKPNSIFSSIDLKSAFHHFALNEQSADRLAFATPKGCYKMNRLPFGLKTSPAECLNALNQVFDGFPKENVIIYVDDILLTS